MTQKESTNIIIALRNRGWAAEEITDFMAFIETHNPTEEEAVLHKEKWEKKEA